MSRPPSRRAFSQTRHEQKGRGTVFPADDPSMWNLIDDLLCAVIPAIAGIQRWVILDACVEYRKYKGSFRGSGQAVWVSYRPLFCWGVRLYAAPLFTVRPARWTFKMLPY